jgi:hypothetical protein
VVTFLEKSLSINDLNAFIFLPFGIFLRDLLRCSFMALWVIY